MSDSRGRLPQLLPSGWYRVASSHALSPEDVRSVRWFGSEWVLYRTGSGQPVLAEAHCPHLGAHLGHGGHVEGEMLRCPFHGWGFDPSGRCVSIPYARRIPAGIRTKTPPLVEHSGRIWAWFDSEGSDPFYQVEEISEEMDPRWETIGTQEWVVRSAVQELSENGADAAHFRFVHDMREVPEMNTRFEGAVVSSLTETAFPALEGGVFDERIEARSFGMGCDVMRYSGGVDLIEVVCTTPIDLEEVHVEMTYRCPRGLNAASKAAVERTRDYLIEQFERDIPIWENKMHRSNPPLCDGEGVIADFRRWCQQFYPVPPPEIGRP